MNGNYLVDTSVIIALLKGDVRAVELFDQADRIFIPAIVVGELFYGAQNSTKKQENMRIFRDFLSQYEIADVFYAELRKLAKKDDIEGLKTALRSHIRMLEDLYNQI